jgi:predicted RNase H-like HicB family nuclease
MTGMEAYQKAALKLAKISPVVGGDCYKAIIPGFKGLIVFGDTVRETRRELASVLEGWIALSLRRGYGLPALESRTRKLAQRKLTHSATLIPA